MLLREFLPTRSAADVWAERVTLRLAGQDYHLAVLPMLHSDEWKAQVLAEAGNVWLGLERIEDLAGVLKHFSTLERDTLIRLLLEYDRLGPGEPLLPQDTGWWYANTSESAVLRAFIEVFAVANPTLAVLVDTLVSAPQVLATVTSAMQPEPGNGQPTPTAGHQLEHGES